MTITIRTELREIEFRKDDTSIVLSLYHPEYQTPLFAVTRLEYDSKYFDGKVVMGYWLWSLVDNLADLVNRGKDKP